MGPPAEGLLGSSEGNDDGEIGVPVPDKWCEGSNTVKRIYNHPEGELLSGLSLRPGVSRLD